MSDAIIGALATARMDALKEAAKLAWSMDAKYMRSKYKIEHNRKRYDVYGVERCENKAANVISEDIHNAILALIPAPPTDAEVLAAAMELPQIKALLVALEELRLEAWGYDHLFETPFHAHVHDTLQYELKKLVQP